MKEVNRNANAALRAQFDDVVARYAKLRDSVGELQCDLDAVEATVRTPDGMVTVVVGPGGAVKRIELHERAYQEHAPQRLAALLTEAARRGAMMVAEAVRARVSEILPDGFDQALRRHDQRMGYRDE